METYEHCKNNRLYQLIREKAGTKMLREAEQVNVYNWVSELISMVAEGPDMMKNAKNQVEQFLKTYPILETEIPMTPILFEEVSLMDEDEVAQLPWIYVHMLRSLTMSGEATTLLDEKLNNSYANAWRQPLPEGVTNEDAFEYIYTQWYQDNRVLIRSITSEVCEAPPCDHEFSKIQNDRYDRVQGRVILRIIKLGDLQASLNSGYYSGDSTRGGGCGCGKGSVEDCECNGHAPASNFVVPPTAPINLLFAAFHRARVEKQIRDLEWGGSPYERTEDYDMTCGGGEGPPPEAQAQPEAYAHLPLPASPISESEQDYEDMPPLESV